MTEMSSNGDQPRRGGPWTAGRRWCSPQQRSGGYAGAVHRTALRLLTVAALVFVPLGCGDGGSDSTRLAHIHGLGVDPADGRLYVASHRGLFVATGEGSPQQISDRALDLMGFTVSGPNEFLSSGHPATGDIPSNMGVLESLDAGKTWSVVSLSGAVDFHAMEVKHGRIYGYDSRSSRIMVTTDRLTWDRRASGAVLDVAVSPTDPDVLLVTTPQGLARSTSGGLRFDAVPTAPELDWIDWPDTGTVVGVTADGSTYLSGDGGTTWEPRSTVAGVPQALTVAADGTIYIASGDAIYRSDDRGATFTVFQEL